MPAHRLSSRPGHTLAELVLVLVVIGLTSAIGLRQVRHWMDRIATRDAVRAAGHLLSRARDDAVALHTFVNVHVDTAARTLELRAQGMRTSVVPIGQLHGVSITTTRDSVTFDVRGLGFGTANFTLVARRGTAADTLTVSRLGRVRY